MQRKIILFVVLCLGLQSTAQAYTKKDLELLRKANAVMSLLMIPANIKIVNIAHSIENTLWTNQSSKEEFKNNLLNLLELTRAPELVDAALCAALEEPFSFLVRASKICSVLALTNEQRNGVFFVLLATLTRYLIHKTVKAALPDKKHEAYRRLARLIAHTVFLGLIDSEGTGSFEHFLFAFIGEGLLEAAGAIIAYNIEEPQEKTHKKKYSETF